MRTIIDLPEDQLEKLAKLCVAERISRAEAIRRAVGRLLEEREAEDVRRSRALAEAFGAWKHMGIDTDAYLAEIRAEWDRDESGDGCSSTARS